MTELKVLMQNMLKELDEQAKLTVSKPQLTTPIWVILGILGIFMCNWYILACCFIIFGRDRFVIEMHNCKDKEITRHVLEIGIQLYEYKVADLTTYLKTKEEVNFYIEDKLIDSFDPINLENMRKQKQAEDLRKIASFAATYLVCNTIANKLVGRKENGLLPW